MSQHCSDPKSRERWGSAWIGKVAGSYELQTVLGSGGMGTVFLGEHVRLGRKAAVKILRPDAREHPEVASRLRSEARAMMRICHPGVVQIIDQDVLEDGTGFLIMEYLPGQSLRERLRQSDGGLPLQVSLRILQQTAAAMAAAHAAGVIHRDLSPANIMCLPVTDEGGIQIKILDFGLARLYSLDGMSSSSSSLTRDGAVLGTLKYMAPEQCLDPHSVDEQADVYSLGVIAYELLAGRAPFVAASSWELIELHLREPPPPLPAREEGPLPAPLSALVLQMLSKRPLSRPTMAEVVERLAPLLPAASPASVSRSEPLGLSLRQRRQQRARLRASAVAAALLLVLGAGGLSLQLRKLRQTIEKQRQQTLVTTDQILTVINQSLRPIPGNRSAIQALLELTDKQLVSLAEQMPADLEVHESLVRLLLLRGDFARHHGALVDAQREYEQAVARARELLRKKPQDVEYRLYLATAHDGLGDAIEQLSDPALARTNYEVALEIRQALLAESPQDGMRVQEVVRSYLLLGDLARTQGLQHSALRAFESAQHLLEPLWKRQPDKKSYRWQMCGILYRQSQILLNLWRGVDGLAMAERALELLTRISPSDQQGMSYQVLLARVLQIRGEARERLGRSAEAEADFRQSYAGVSALLKAAPLDVQARRAVIDSAWKVADHQLRLGKIDDAALLAGETLKLAESLLQTDGAHHGHRYRLAGSLQRVGDVALRRGQLEEAQRSFRRAMETEESLAAATVDAVRRQDLMVALAERLGDVAAEGPYIGQALPLWGQALSMIQAQERIEPGWGDLRFMMARILRKRAAVQLRLGRPSEAQRDLEEAAAGVRGLLAIEPTDAMAKGELVEINRLAARLGAASRTTAQ